MLIECHKQLLRKELSMNANELITIWGAPEPPKLTPKQLSIRLPILVSAKISALCELYPSKTKTEIIGDLLTTALDELEKAFPRIQGRQLEYYPEHGEIPAWEDAGVRPDYLRLTEKYLRELEKEAEVTEPMPFDSRGYIYDGHDDT